MRRITLKPREVVSPRNNYLTQRHTAFPSFAALLDARGGYSPSLRTQSAPEGQDRAEIAELADTYDQAQAERSDPRRAYRS